MKENNFKKGDLVKIIYSGLIYPSIANYPPFRLFFSNNFILDNSLIENCSDFKNNYGFFIKETYLTRTVLLEINYTKLYLLFVPQQKSYCFIQERGIVLV